MRRTKTIVGAAVLAFALAFSLAGCTGTTTTSSSSASTSTTASQSAVASSQSSKSTESTSESSAAQSKSDASTNAQTSTTSSSTSSGKSSTSASLGKVDPDSYADKNQTGAVYDAPDIEVYEDETYTDKDHVALYLHEFGHLPSNYITKTKARKAGWVQEEGNLDEVLPGMSIGGGGFYNDDHMMPNAPKRSWYECDIDYEGGYRNAKRLVYSNDGLIYYTNDHYKTFQRLY